MASTIIQTPRNECYNCLNQWKCTIHCDNCRKKKRCPLHATRKIGSRSGKACETHRKQHAKCGHDCANWTPPPSHHHGLQQKGPPIQSSPYTPYQHRWSPTSRSLHYATSPFLPRTLQDLPVVTASFAIENPHQGGLQCLGPIPESLHIPISTNTFEVYYSFN